VVEAARRVAAGGHQIAVFDQDDSAGLEHFPHLAQAGLRIGKMQQQEAAIHDVEGITRQAGVEGASGEEGDVGEALRRGKLTALLGLILVEVNTGDVTGGPGQLGKRARGGTDAGAEIADLHAGG